MIGNSITHYWTDRSGADAKDYRSSWDKLFRGRVARNLGFGFDRIENGLWRVMHGELDGYSADKIFLLLGTNNLSRAVRQHQPKARIYQVGIMPRRGQLQRVAHINALLQEKLKNLRESAEGKGWDVTYVDMSRGFLDDSGNLIESLFSDGLHPNARGYEVEAQNLYPYIK